MSIYDEDHDEDCYSMYTCSESPILFDDVKASHKNVLNILEIVT